jgi:hypothetical protein
MADDMSVAEITRALATDPAYRTALTERLAARAIDQKTLRALIDYARRREATMGQAMARQVLTDAGVSWEAL